MTANVDFSEADLETLRQMWAAGDTTAAIGRAMKRSKNSVVGKAHRMGLPARPTPIRAPGSGARPRVPRPHVPRAPLAVTAAPRITLPPSGPMPDAAAEAAAPAPLPAPLSPSQRAAAREGCQWPLWEGRLRRGDPMPFCGAPRRSLACSFCAAHAASAFDRPQLSGRTQARAVAEQPAGLARSADG